MKRFFSFVFCHSALAGFGLACAIVFAGCDIELPELDFLVKEGAARQQARTAAIEFASSAGVTGEMASFAFIDVRLSLPDGDTLSSDATCNVTDTGTGTATPGADYLFSTTRVTFPAGSQNGDTRSVTVAVLADNEAELDETVTLTIANVTGARAGTVASHALSIAMLDPDPVPLDPVTEPTVEFTQFVRAFDEWDGIADLEVLLSVPGGGALSQDMVFSIVKTNGNADILEFGIVPPPPPVWPSPPWSWDLQSLRPLDAIVIPAGSPDGTIVTVDLTIFNDTLGEFEELALFEIENINGGVAGACDTMVLLIRDDHSDWYTTYHCGYANSVVYVFDRSEAMAERVNVPIEDRNGFVISSPRLYDIAMLRLWQELDGPNAPAEFAVVTHGVSPGWTWMPGLIVNTLANREAAYSFVSNYALVGANRPLYTALRLACETYGTDVSRISLIGAGDPSLDAQAPSGLDSAAAVLADFPGWYSPLEANGCMLECLHMGSHGAGASFYQSLAAIAGGVFIQLH